MAKKKRAKARAPSKKAKKRTAKKAKSAKKKAVKKTKKNAAKGKKNKKPKSTVNVTITKKVLGKAPEEYHFVLHDGRKLESVYELIDELETMTEETFKHYVNQIENHFANWLDHVFHEKHLADELRKIQNKVETQRTLLKHMVRELIHEMKKK